MLTEAMCTYDGTPLPVSDKGIGGECPTCAAEQAEHERTCKDCRENPTLPEEGGLTFGLL